MRREEAAWSRSGLTFAGASGTCGLAMLLLKAPWNREGGSAPVCAVDGGSACAAGGSGGGSTCAVGGARRA